MMPNMKKEDVIHLARLARIAITDTEAEKLCTDIDSVLAYVSTVSAITGGEATKQPGALKNVFREDVVTNDADAYTETLLAEAPKRKGRYLAVKKILHAE